MSLRHRCLFVVGVVTILGCISVGPVQAQDTSIEQQLDSIEQEINSEEDNSSQPTRTSDAPDAAGESESKLKPTATAHEADSGGAEISAWDLYRDPVVCALIAGAVLGLLGVYVVARRIVFVSAALSQVSALGIAIGFLAVAFFGVQGIAHDLIPPFVAIAASLAVVFLLTAVGENPSLPGDAILGLSFVVPMAGVLVLGPYIPQEMHEIQSLLHGSAVVVQSSDIWVLGVAGTVILATQLVAYRGFIFASLDPTVARAQGVSVDWLDAILYGSVALMIGLVTRVLGALPAFALTVLPAMGALGFRLGLARVLVLASVLGAVSGAGGYGLAYYMNWSVGASQTLAAAILMILARMAGKLAT